MIKRTSQTIMVFTLFTLFFVSCGTKPSDLIKEDKMVELLQDLYKADAILKKDKKYNSFQKKDALVDAIFKKHKVTQENFDKSLDWYAENIDIYNGIVDTVGVRLQRELDIASKESTDIYKNKLFDFTTELPAYYILDQNISTFRFRIDSLKIKDLNDTKHICLIFETRGVDTSLHKINAALYFKYSDTTILAKQEVVKDSLYILDHPNRSDSLLKEISGFVHMRMLDTSKVSTKVLLKNISNQKDSTFLNKSDSISVPSEAKELELITNE